MLFVSISFEFGSQCKRSFQWNMGLILPLIRTENTKLAFSCYILTKLILTILYGLLVGTFIIFNTGISYTVNVEMFVLYIFSHYSRFPNIRENMQNAKLNFTLSHRALIIPETQI